MEDPTRMEEHGDHGDNGDQSVSDSGTTPHDVRSEVRVRVRKRDSFLFNTRIPFWKYVIRMGLLSLLPSLLLAGLLTAAGVITEGNSPSFAIPEEAPPELFYPFLVVGFLFCSPVFETIALGFTLWALSHVTQDFIKRALMAAVIWGILHSIQAPAWGLVVWWPFFIFSCAFLAWRRVSWVHAFLAAALLHFIQNFLPAIAVVVMLAGSGS
jgi:hypothetical protein